MRNDNDKKTSLILSACGVVPVVWLALLTAPYVGGGIVEIIRGLTDAMGSPFAITVCEDSVKTVLIFLAAYGMAIGIYFSTRRNYRRREEHGSAKWGNADAFSVSLTLCNATPLLWCLTQRLHYKRIEKRSVSQTKISLKKGGQNRG